MTALAPFREKRAELDRNPDYVFDVLHEGAKRARVIAQQTMAEVRAGSRTLLRSQFRNPENKT